MLEQWEINHMLRWNAAGNVATLLGISINTDHRAFTEFRDKFAKTLGYQMWEDIRAAQDKNYKEANHVLQMLQGPHALAIYKAMQARK